MHSGQGVYLVFVKESSQLQPRHAKKTDRNTRAGTHKHTHTISSWEEKNFSGVLGSQQLPFKRISKETKIRATGHVAKLSIRLIPKSEIAGGHHLLTFSSVVSAVERCFHFKSSGKTDTTRRTFKKSSLKKLS